MVLTMHNVLNNVLTMHAHTHSRKQHHDTHTAQPANKGKKVLTFLPLP